ncbi:MAG: hypothetical protein V8T45_10800 [Oscillospiraceae bacterium]
MELAQYKYLLPRLTGMRTHLVRQTASGGSSPIGTRGPGETQLETDRRHIRRKIQKLEELAAVRKVRSTQRRKREKKNAIPVVALVGYTNAGKSTSFQLPYPLRYPRQQPAIRHSGHHHPPLQNRRDTGGPAFRHRGLYPQAPHPSY